MKDELFDEVQGGIYIGGKDSPISPRTMQRWRLEGRPPKFLKIASMVRYRKSELDAYLAGCLRQSTSDSGNFG